MRTATHRGVRGARSKDVRRENLASVLRHVHVNGPTSRSQLAQALSLNRSTIGDLTSELAVAGLVRDEAGGAADRLAVPGHPGGGRPSHVVRPETEHVQVLAVDIGVTHLTVARVGLGGTVLTRRDLAQRRGPRSPRQLVRSIGAVARELLAELPAGVLVVGAGAAVAGMVRASDGLVRQVPNLGWSEVPLGADLSAELGVPVTVGNDADLGALAEHVRGAAVGCDDLVYLAGHSGIGAGVFTSGRPLVGRGGYAGEVGHLVINPGGRRCECGACGCWETEAGEERLLELAGLPPGGGLAAVRAVVASAEADPASAAAKALTHVATWLGRGTACVVNILNPDVVVLGGALAEIYAAAGPAVRSALEASALAAPHEGLRLLLPYFGLDSALVGAAELAFDPLLADPVAVAPRLTAS